MEKLSQIWFNIQGFLFPFMEEEIQEPLTEKLEKKWCKDRPTISRTTSILSKMLMDYGI